jgi:hypothetical protein
MFKLMFLVLFLWLPNIENVYCASVTLLYNTNDTITPFPRQNFALAIDPFAMNACFLFGGDFYDFDSTNATFYNDVWSFKLLYSGGNKYVWREVTEVTGDIPSERAFPCFDTVTITNTQPYVVLFGGSVVDITTGDQTVNDDFAYLFDPYTFNWINITDDAISDGLTKRTGSACAANQNALYIYGGIDGSNTILNELWIYNLTDNAWSSLTPLPAEARWNARMAGIIIDAELYLFLFGGINVFPVVENASLIINESNILHDLWKYDVYNDTWVNSTVALTSNYVPRRIGFEVFPSYSLETFWIFGGNILNDSYSDVPVIPLNTTLYDLNTTACSASQKGFTVPQLWKYDNRVTTWFNETLETVFTPYNNTFVPPLANHRGIRLSNFLYLFGGIIQQCPLTNGIWNTNVSRIYTQPSLPFT